MQDHLLLDDKTFLNQFKEASLDPKLFSHEAHLRLAWLHINAYGVDKAVEQVCKQIKNYTMSLGASDKFNKTVTVAAVKAVYHFKLRSKSLGFNEFIEEFPRLKFNFKDLLAQHYNIDIFSSELAKSTFLEPNLLPFD